MWGLKIYQKRQAIVKAASSIFYETQHLMIYGFDQSIINNYLKPLTVNDSVQIFHSVQNYILKFHILWLKYKINNLLKLNCLQLHHDSFCCGNFGASSIPFPTRRLNAEYVGQIVDGLSYPLPETCPEKCRPRDRLNWTRCWCQYAGYTNYILHHSSWSWSWNDRLMTTWWTHIL